MIGEEGERHYVIIKEEKKTFLALYLQTFSAEEILKSHIKDYFKISGKQVILMPKNGEFVEFKNYTEK